MRFAFHLIGDRVSEFSDLLDMPHSAFYDPDEKIQKKSGVFIEENISMPLWAEAIQYKTNSTILSKGLKYLLFYGDIKQIKDDRKIPVVCDIMDESFWYYMRSLKKLGLFTFSVNTTLCDLVVCQETVKLVSRTYNPVYYEDLT